MPRLSPHLLRRASRIDRLLPQLLNECRDVHSARNELRWMREHIASLGEKSDGAHSHVPQAQSEALLSSYVRRRAKGEPLQYILGTQPFGNLEILCRKNVLIPRAETETYTLELTRRLAKIPKKDETRRLQVVDFCTGTGCIALLAHAELCRDHHVSTYGFDVSLHALRLAQANLRHNVERGHLDPSVEKDISFHALNVLHLSTRPLKDIQAMLAQQYDLSSIDIVISNPPYISEEQYKPGGTTTSSVRRYEPKLALVPPQCVVECFEDIVPADIFYAALLRISVAMEAKVLLVEVGDTEQALRVSDLFRRQRMMDCDVEIWMDDGEVVSGRDAARASSATDVSARAVVIWMDPDQEKVK